jgi:hypothetical protein
LVFDAKVAVQCDVSRVEEVSNNFKPNRTIINENQHVSSSSHYKSDVFFFSDGTFYQQIFGNPISLKTGEDKKWIVMVTTIMINLESHASLK